MIAAERAQQLPPGSFSSNVSGPANAPEHVASRDAVSARGTLGCGCQRVASVGPRDHHQCLTWPRTECTTVYNVAQSPDIHASLSVDTSLPWLPPCE